MAIVWVRHYVRIDRADGSRTYKGAWHIERCEREAAAWRESFPGYAVTIVPAADPEVSADVRRWAKATRQDQLHNNPPYFPQES